MSRDKPRVSIGLPVYNGEDYIQEALDSLLTQTFEDFELIISDNASTDKTQEICLAYVAKDKRIRYYGNEKNLGAAKNFNRTFELSSGEYFKWAAHDDLIAPEFLARCVEILDQNPSVVLCYSEPKLINEKGEVVADYDPILSLKSIGSQRPQDRFGDIILIPHYCFEVFGLIRTSALAKTSLIASHIGSDRNLLAELSLLGPFYKLPKPHFFSRDHARQSIKSLKIHDRAPWFDPTNKGRLVLPRWNLLSLYFKSINHASLDWQERTQCYIQIMKWIPLYGRGLLKDLLVAGTQLMSVSKGKITHNKMGWLL